MILLVYQFLLQVYLRLNLVYLLYLFVVLALRDLNWLLVGMLSWRDLL